MNTQLTTLFRPVGPRELALIRSTDFLAFPPRLPSQPIFYPVLNAEYAMEIAQRWNVPDSGSGYVVRFDVRTDFISRFSPQKVGNKMHLELWIPAGELQLLNENIVGKIEIIAEFPSTK